MILIVGGAYQGKAEFARTLAKEENLLLNVHERIREELSGGVSREEIEERLFSDIREDMVLTADEVGYGIVPMDAFERRYRETAGRILCEAAKRADTVYRVIAGIPVTIKG